MTTLFDNRILEIINEESLRDWFGHNKGKGWIDCKTGKPCGRQKGEKRKGYPACRPTKSACNSRKRHKKSGKRISWKKNSPVK